MRIDLGRLSFTSLVLLKLKLFNWNGPSNTNEERGYRDRKDELLLLNIYCLAAKLINGPATAPSLIHFPQTSSNFVVFGQKTNIVLFAPKHLSPFTKSPFVKEYLKVSSKSQQNKLYSFTFFFSKSITSFYNLPIFKGDARFGMHLINTRSIFKLSKSLTSVKSVVTNIIFFSFNKIVNS